RKGDQTRNHDPLAAEKESQAVHVFVGYILEADVKGRQETGAETFLLLVLFRKKVLQEDGAKRRAQRQGVDGRDKDGDSQRIAEVPVEHTRRDFQKA